ncbi:D-alanyl-D-alanine carboxypeptidase family protein [Selenomonas sp. AB3002]|uniref:D-alanyl-D-alanine carboxypeptidase family protein n=1 Tax=Selenomonas sp. AB3002 TaxID=1392502 RepID=UPI00163A0EE4
MAEAQEDIKLSADAAIVMEASTGRVIWEKNADERRYPASMTKMMTGLLTLENLSADTEVLISANAAATEDVPMGLLPGEMLSSAELLNGLLMLSDNGAAVALAEQIGGSVSSFAEMMNAKAEKLGMENTHFVNPNGLTNAEHYSTARDMAKLARHVMQNERFREIVGQQKALLRWSIPKNKMLAAENTNELLGKYEGMTGIKTGWTQAAGGCLAASAKQGGLELIVIVMHAETPKDRFKDAEKLLDYGFEHTRLVRGVNKERFRGSAWVKDGREAKVDLHLAEDINFPLVDAEEKSNYKVVYDVKKVLAAPVKKGQKAGTAKLLYKGEQVGEVDILADKNVGQGSDILSWLVGVFEPVFDRL